MRRSFAPVACLLFALSLACGGWADEIERAVEAGSNGEIDIDLGGGSGGDRPRAPTGWPRDVPLYGGATVTASMTVPSTAGGNDYMVSFDSPDAPATIVAFYKKELGGAFDVAAESNDNGTRSVMFETANHKRAVSVIASPGPGGSGSSVGVAVSRML